jgi:hypothetical protein
MRGPPRPVRHRSIAKPTTTLVPMSAADISSLDARHYTGFDAWMAWVTGSLRDVLSRLHMLYGSVGGLVAFAAAE